jgi:hypothetical protein
MFDRLCNQLAEAFADPPTDHPRVCHPSRAPAPIWPEEPHPSDLAARDRPRSSAACVGRWHPAAAFACMVGRHDERYLAT